MRSRPKRRRYFVDPKFQLAHLAGYAVSTIVIALVVGGVVANLFLFKLPKTRVDESLWRPEFLSHLMWVILAATVAACVRAVFVSHKIVGPLFRLKGVMRAVGQGDLSCQMQFRTRDRLQDVGVAFDEMIQGLRTLVHLDRTFAGQVADTAKRAGQMLESGELTPDRVQELRNLLDRITRKADSIAADFKTEGNPYDASL
jgi:methyl-accepting chemotaxis protein